jgi:hypothetical protein
MAATVAGAQADLEDAINRGQLHDDPLQYPLRAVSLLLCAMHRLCVDFLLTFKAAQTPPLLLTPEVERQLCARLGEEAGTAVEAATWRAHRRMDWRLAGMIGTALAITLAAGVGIGYWRGWVGAYAAADARIVDAGSVLGTLSAGDAAAWAKLVRDNPPIRDLLSHARPNTAETRGKAVTLDVWVDPPKPATPGAH